MKSLLMLLAVLLFHDAATAQKIVAVTSSPLTGIFLPPQTKMDKRILIESAGKSQLKD
jgi:hypothetical protein